MALQDMFKMGKKKKKSGGPPKCGVCDHTMRPSVDGKGNPIWICPLNPEHTKPRIK